MTQRPERPPIWPLVVGLMAIVLVVVGVLNVVDWVFRLVTTLVVGGLVVFLAWFVLRRR